MESVILAAGKGQRMEGVAKPFFKPLLEINGMPLVAYAVEYASAAGATRVTVVASNSNFEEISKALKVYASWVSVVVQDTPRGPGDAALIGLENTFDSSTMLLMSDNIMNSSLVSEMATSAMIQRKDAIGIVHVHLEKAERFTRIRTDILGQRSYVEGAPIDKLDESTPGMTTVWCGPLIFERDRAIEALSRAKLEKQSYDTELKIGPYLNLIMRQDALLVNVGAMDVGIPAEYAQQIKKN